MKTINDYAGKLLESSRKETRRNVLALRRLPLFAGDVRNAEAAGSIPAPSTKFSSLEFFALPSAHQLFNSSDGVRIFFVLSGFLNSAPAPVP
jgi:hypothetical protein